MAFLEQHRDTAKISEARCSDRFLPVQLVQLQYEDPLTGTVDGADLLLPQSGARDWTFCVVDTDTMRCR